MSIRKHPTSQFTGPAKTLARDIIVRGALRALEPAEAVDGCPREQARAFTRH